MKYRYCIISTIINDVTTYGIASTVNYDGCTKIIESFIDLSTQKALVEHLVNLCNSLCLDPDHLQDVVYDFLMRTL